MKVLVVVDKIPSAIWVCAKAMERVKDWLDIDIIGVHPKRPSEEQLKEFEEKAKEADIIDFQYWKTAEMLVASYPFLKDKKKILTHHNPYDVDKENWFEKYDEVIVKNNSQKKTCETTFRKTPVLIPHSIDLNLFQFKRDYVSDDIFKAIMVVARIESHKGVLEVAKACRETKTKLILVGRVSDMDYMREVMAEAGNLIDFRQDITDEELRDAYYESNIFINNSADNFESGTLPHLEAMACGVPVLTRNVGLVPDIGDNWKNMVIREGAKEDWREIAKLIEEMKKDRDLRIRLREEGFKTILSRDYQYTAESYYRVYKKVLGKGQPLVSVIIPTFNRADSLIPVLTSVIAQTYDNLEVLLVDDGSSDDTEDVFNTIKALYRGQTVLRYIKLVKDGYGLARARNTGILEALGEILVFVDDRLVLDANAVSNFVNRLKPRYWIFGKKDGGKADFVENFSCIYKKDIVGIGMFNERVNYYGGMTRDIVNRIRYNRLDTLYCPECFCSSFLGSKSQFTKKNEIIKAKLLLWKLWG